MIRIFTGRHMLGCCVLFFGTIVTVNMVMAIQASRTFGGTVVDNSYIASQHFNRWLDEAKVESRLEWRIDAWREDGHALLTVEGPKGTLPNATISGIALHPLGHRDDVRLHFRLDDKGRFRSIETLPIGRWRLKLDIRVGDDRARILRDLPA